MPVSFSCEVTVRRILPFVLVAAVAFALGWVVRESRSVSGKQPAASESRAVFVTFPYDGKRVVKSLLVNRISASGTVTDYSPADPDKDWYIEVGGTIYLCSPRE